MFAKKMSEVLEFEASETVRREEFAVTDALRLDVSTASGDLEVVEGTDATVVVTMTTNDPSPSARLAEVRCEYDAASNRLTINTDPANGDGLRSLARRLRRYDVDLTVVVPAGASVHFATASGDATLDAPVESFDVKSASGDLTVREVTGRGQIRTASGDVEIESAGTRTEIASVSGEVAARGLRGDATVRTVSGDVTLSILAGGAVRIDTVSGDATVAVGPGLIIDVDASAVSGSLRSEIDLDDTAASTESDRATVTLRSRSVSGDLRVTRAVG